MSPSRRASDIELLDIPNELGRVSADQAPKQQAIIRLQAEFL